jgi:hypothetical protein
MGHALDVELHDYELDDEIQLLAELMVFASTTDGALDERDVDGLLGLERSMPRQRIAG